MALCFYLKVHKYTKFRHEIVICFLERQPEMHSDRREPLPAIIKCELLLKTITVFDKIQILVDMFSGLR